ncbi:MAG: glycosyltransferase family 39 protein [Planctomycetota bacterium]
MDLNHQNGHFLEPRDRARHEWWLWLGPYLIWFLIFIPGLFSHDPWAFDELRYMEVARQTGEYGHWLVMHINGDLYPEKPPFFFWCAALVHKLIGGGSWVVAGRLTVALAVLGSVFQVQKFGRWMFKSQRVGAFAAGLMLTFIFMIDTGTRVLLDPFFMALTTATTIALIHAGAASTRKCWAFQTALASFWMAAACMTKGPVAIAVSVILAVVIGWRWRGFKQVSFATIGIATVASLGAVVGWVYIVSLEVGPQFMDQMIFKQVIGRAKKAHHHGKPWWMYFANAPRMLYPWILFLPAIIFSGIVRRKQLWVKRANAVGWGLLGVFFFFTMMSGKRMGYLTPLYPFLAIYLAAHIRELWLRTATFERRLGFKAPAVVFLAVPILAGLGLIVAGGAIRWGFTDSFIDSNNFVLQGLQGGRASFMLLGGMLMLVLAGQLILLVTKQKIEHAAMLILIAIAFGVSIAHVTIYRAYDGLKSGKGLYLAAQRIVPEDARLVLMDDHKDGVVNYYWNTEHHDIVKKENLISEADKPGTLYVVALKKQWKKVPKKIAERFELAVSWKFSGRPRNIYREKLSGK